MKKKLKKKLRRGVVLYEEDAIVVTLTRRSEQATLGIRINGSDEATEDVTLPGPGQSRSWSKKIKEF